MTAQRKLILQTLEALGRHPTAEELYDAVSKLDSNLNLSTVYRTLRWLEQEGLVSARRFDEERRQERFDPFLPAEHHHFLCTVCKRVIEFHDESIETVKNNFEELTGVCVESASVTFYGLCRRCRDGAGV